VNAIEKGKKEMRSKMETVTGILSGKLGEAGFYNDVMPILEQAAIAHANERVIEELEMVSSMLWEKSNYEMDIPGDYVQTDECVEWIDKRIKELQSSH